MLKLNVFLILALIQLSFVKAQEIPESEKAYIETKALTFAAISTSDIESSAKWYKNIFDLQESFEYKSKTGDLVIKVLSNDRFTIELQYHENAKKTLSSVDKPFLNFGIFKFGIYVINLSEAMKVIQENKIDIVVEPFKDLSGKFHSAVIKDNEGNFIQLFEIISEIKGS